MFSVLEITEMSKLDVIIYILFQLFKLCLNTVFKQKTKGDEVKESRFS